MAEVNFDIFNMDDTQMKINTGKQSNNVYSPKYSDGKDNTYQAIIRFLPNPEDPYNGSWVQKTSYWFDVADYNIRGYFDSPQMIGEECPINKKYWELKNAGDKGDARAEKNAKKVGNRDIKYYSYVLIVKDPQNPDLEGTVQVFKYPNQIKKLIDEQNEEKKGIDLEGEDNVKCNIFNPISGKNFLLHITKKGDFANYEKSKFKPNSTVVKIDDEEVTESKDAAKKLKQMLSEVKTKLSSFAYKPWSEEDEQKINKYLRSLTTSAKADADDDGDFDFDDDSSSKKTTSKTTTKKKDDDDFDFDDEVTSSKKETKKTAKNTKAKETKKEEPKDEVDNDDLDDFLNDL